MKTEKSCGAIIFRKYQWAIEFLIVQQKQGGHWFFPKGHVETGESEEQTALREIYEEIGLQAHILPWFKEILSYHIDTTDVDKTVVFFLCTVASWSFTMADELQNVARLSYEQALQQLTHDNAKAVLTKAYAFLAAS